MAMLTRGVSPLQRLYFYLCGPAQFTQGLYVRTASLNIADDRIQAEPFGPSSLIRTGDAKVAAVSPRRAASEKPVPVCSRVP